MWRKHGIVPCVDRHGPLPHPLPERILPPPVCSPVLGRAKLSRWLADLPRRRLSVLIAGAGYGKSIVLAGWAADHHCAWYTADHADREPLTLARGLVAALRLRVPDLPDELLHTLSGVRGPGSAGGIAAFVPALATALHERLRRDLVLVIDDVHHVFEGAESMRCLAELIHIAPQRLHLALASRTELPFPITRLQMAGHAAVLTAESLRFDRTETAELLDLVAGAVPPEQTDRLVALTGGWPAAVRLAAEALATADDWTAVVDGWGTPGGLGDLMDDLLSNEVIPRLPPEQQELLRVGGALATFDVDLLDHLGVLNASDAVAAARTRGILVMPTAADPRRFALTEVARRYAERRLAAADTERIRRAAAEWFRQRGEFDEALRYLVLLDASADVADLLTRVGAQLLTGGHAGLVLAACAVVRPGHRGPALDLVEGEAYQLRGDWDSAVDRLSRLVPDDGSVPVAVAWRLGLIHHQRGDLPTALQLYRRGLSHPAPGQERDRALAAGWGAAAAWLCGEIEECRRLTALAVRLAEDCRDPGAAAAAHTAMALLAALDGDRRANDMHYVQALRHAEKAGDTLHVIRIRSNRGSRLLEEGEYAGACAELDVAVRLAELADFAVLRALALVNRGDARRLLGRLEEATRDAQSSLAELQRLGSRLAAYPLIVLGDIHLAQGDAVQAQARYEEAVSLTETTGDLQGLQPALAGLAVALLREDIEAAARYVERAVTIGPALGQTRALLAEARVALAQGDRSRAVK
ncbi:MAG: transcriptional regulator, partial [Micromonosporaceae bacterium]|nr:transcriptional regulator [Micromonosporaceae bacterium]